MSESIYDRINRTLSWKRIVGFNVVLLLVLVIPLTVQLVNTDTENRSGAAGELEPSPIIPPPNYPVNPPTLERVNTFFGKTGDTIVLIGTNFGDYQWGSKVFVGNVEAPKEMIVRWSNNILEVKIPEGARTGKVWVTINGKQASWGGNLILYDKARATQIGIQKLSATTGRIFLTGGAQVVRGMVELGHASEPLTVLAIGSITVSGQTTGADSLSKTTIINFEAASPISTTQTSILEFSYPGIGTVEVIRAELLDGAGRLISVYADPLSSKLLP